MPDDRGDYRWSTMTAAQDRPHEQEGHIPAGIPISTTSGQFKEAPLPRI